MKRFATTLAAAAALAAPAAAHAHMPGTDGGPAQRGCVPVNYGATYVGATRVSCRIARIVARGVTNGESFTRWSCTWSAGTRLRTLPRPRHSPWRRRSLGCQRLTRLRPTRRSPAERGIGSPPAKFARWKF